MHHARVLGIVLAMSLSSLVANSVDADPVELGKLVPRGERRIVYVSDPSNTTGLYGDPTTEEEMRAWVRNLAAAGVDTHIQCVFQQAWSNFFRSDHCRYDARPRHSRFIPMMERGTVPLEVLIDESHKQGMEFMAAFRMNDRHGDNEEFFEQHKESRLEPFNSALDYSIPEVRDWMFSIAEEVARRFDIDGLELNFIRHGHSFPSETAEKKQPTMTRFVTTGSLRRQPAGREAFEKWRRNTGGNRRRGTRCNRERAQLTTGSMVTLWVQLLFSLEAPKL